MKKLLAILLAILMVFSLTACGGNNDDSADDSSDEGDKIYKVAVLLPFIGDQSYFDTIEKGRKTVDEKYDNVETRLIEVGNTTDEAPWMQAYDEVCEDGEYDLVVSCNTNYEAYLYEAARKYPDQMFLNCDTSNPEDVDNCLSVNFGLDDLGYVVGALSAAITKTGKVGVVVGMDNQGMNQFISGYVQVLAAQGVQYAISYPNSFTDTALGYEAANTMINKGVDVIWQVAGGLGNGVIEACSEHDDVWCVGVDQDQYVQFEESKPEWAKTIITSALKNTDIVLETTVDMLVEGTLQDHMGKVETWGIKENGVGLAENDFYKANVSEEVRAQIASILQEVADGKVEVYDCKLGEESQETYTANWPAIRDANIIK